MFIDNKNDKIYKLFKEFLKNKMVGKYFMYLGINKVRKSLSFELMVLTLIILY